MDQDNMATNFELPTPQHASGGPSHADPSAGIPDPVRQDAGQSAVPSLAQTPPAADDADLIEKEWVQKAKQIVAATNQDPYAQNKEFSRFKADYLKKRYNKIIKVDES